VSALVGERHGRGPSDDGEISLSALEQNPYPIYRRLRDEGVVWVEAAGRWLVTRWDDVDAVERDSDAFTAMEEASLQTRVMGRTMLRSDGADHRRLRRAAQTALSPQAIERHWLPEFRRIAEELIDGFADRGAADLMPEFCGPFAARCLGRILGFTDASDRDLQFWSQALMDATANYADEPDVWAVGEIAASQVDAATDAAIERVRATPDHSVISAMVHADGDGRPLTREEIVANTKLMIGGGLNEPRDGLGFAIWALLTHPEARALALADPTAWPAITEEALRWMSPLAMFPRQVAKPVRLADTVLEPGARLGLLVAAANRDERHWEAPDRFDVHRPKQRTVAFGVGHHFCLGVWMARAQIGGAALPALFGRLEALTADLDNPPEIRGWVFRGHTRLHSTWSR
jgi:cytochrome P450